MFVLALFLQGGRSACNFEFEAVGQWASTHQGIAFADDDTLIDGQHRLLAIVKATMQPPICSREGSASSH